MIRTVTKQRRDATLDHYDAPPPMEEKIYHAEAILGVTKPGQNFPTFRAVLVDDPEENLELFINTSGKSHKPVKIPAPISVDNVKKVASPKDFETGIIILIILLKGSVHPVLEYLSLF